jgi:RHS repeat-associated protein
MHRAREIGSGSSARKSSPESGLHYYRARYYDPGAGRFLSEDPLRFQATANFFAYVDNGPISWLDPGGLCKVEMRYTQVSGTGGAYHATLIVTDNSGAKSTPLFYRGQPNGPWWKPGTKLEALSGFDVPDPTLNPDWDPKAPSQKLIDDCSPCKSITDKLDKYVLRINISNIPYRARTTNSNAFASGAAADAGLPVPTPPNNLWVPGFGTPLPVVPLPVPPSPKH